MGQTYTAACKTGRGQMELREFQVPSPGRDELLIRIDRAAICGSDLHAIFDGIGFLAGDDAAPQPGSPGHEGVGIVEKADRATGFRPGDHVLVLSIGSYAELMVAPAAQCVKLAPDAPLDTMVMAQQLGVTHYAMRRFCPEPGADGTAAVIGAGSIGLNFLQLLRLRGFERVIVSDVSRARLKLAELLGADTVVLAPEESVVEAIMDATGGAGADLTVEAAGYDTTRSQAILGVRTLGRVGLFGYPETTAGSSPLPYADAFWKAPVSIEVVKGAQEVKCLPDFHAAIELISSGTVSVDHLLGTEFPLADIQPALQAARNRDAIKVQLRPGTPR
jgi:L-iditol 2-dehydrogenase